jgi:hypothetical protein
MSFNEEDGKEEGEEEGEEDGKEEGEEEGEEGVCVTAAARLQCGTDKSHTSLFSKLYPSPPGRHRALQKPGAKQVPTISAEARLRRSVVSHLFVPSLSCSEPCEKCGGKARHLFVPSLSCSEPCEKCGGKARHLFVPSLSCREPCEKCGGKARHLFVKLQRAL